MSNQNVLPGAVSHFFIRINGDLAEEEMQSIDSVVIESSLHLPDMATVVLRDLTPLKEGAKAYRFIDDQKGKFKHGNPLKISVKVGDTKEDDVFDGEIVEVEAQILGKGQRLVIRAFDRLHKLSRGTRTRTFNNVTDMDVVQKVASDLGLKSEVGKATFVHEYIMQSNQTDLEFLRARAAAMGYLLYMDGEVLHCEPVESKGDAGVLKWGANLIEFHPRLSSTQQASETISRGWDPQRKQVVMSGNIKGKGEPEAAATKEDDLGKTYTFTDRVVRQEKQADMYAQGNADQKKQRLLEASGVAGGSPKMSAGMSVEIDGVSDRFKGKYILSSVTHQFYVDSGYTTEFTISGMRATDIAQTLAGAQKAKQQHGFVIGIVTNNKDEKNQGRVKVKFPWLSDKDESDWARVAAPGAGKSRGMAWIPEVDDEVLVGFEMGDIHHPYIVGGLWNGVDATPEPTDKLVKGGKTMRRVQYSRKGHKIILDDSDDKPGITVEDMNGNIIQIDSKTNKLTITMKGDVEVQAQGRMDFKAQTIDLKAQAGIKIDAGGGMVDVKGTTIKLN